MPYNDFQAKAEQHYYAGAGNYTVPVTLHYDNNVAVMKITCDHEYVYITREQAMKFFNLKD